MVVLEKEPDAKLGISIRGGGKGSKGNPLDRNDEGIFISKVRVLGWSVLYYVCVHLSQSAHSSVDVGTVVYMSTV